MFWAFWLDMALFYAFQLSFMQVSEGAVTRLAVGRVEGLHAAQAGNCLDTHMHLAALRVIQTCTCCVQAPNQWTPCPGFLHTLLQAAPAQYKYVPYFGMVGWLLAGGTKQSDSSSSS